MRSRLWFFVSVLFWMVAAGAQGYPNQSIRLIVPWPPGGGVDTSARIISQPLSERLGQSIVIDNRPGAGGNIGTEIAARAKPDGYTLLMGSSSPNAINIHIYPKLPFDPLKDFTSIAYVTAVPNILVVPGGSPMASARDLALPNVPTFDEIDVPGVYSSAWYGIMAPAGVPQDIVDRINAEVNAILKTPEMKKRLADFGGEVGGGSPTDFDRFVASELRRYADVVKASGARVE